MPRRGGTGPRLAVVGAGVAGLAAARMAVDSRPDLEVVVLEESPRAGGLVETERTADGFVIEHGADCLLTSKPAGLRAVRRMGLEPEIVHGTDAPRTTFLVRRGRLVPLPAGLAFGVPTRPTELLRTDALSWPSKLRMGLEPFVPTPPDKGDESVAAFVGRRFGRGFVEQILEPLLGGIHGVPAAELSARASLPRLSELERTHGSVVAGMRRHMRAHARDRAPGPPVISLRRGMESLPEAYARSLGERIRFGSPVRRIERVAGGGYRLALDGDTLEADAVIVAVPADVAARLVEGLSRALATLLGRVRHSPLASVVLGWRRDEVDHPLDGTGFVTPRGEGRTTRACSWLSAKWPARAPEDAILIRSVLDAPDVTDEELIEVARADLKDLMGIGAEPRLVRTRRRARALPVYEVGYPDRLDAMRAEARNLGAFALAGNAQGGIGIPDCIQSGCDAAGTVLSRIG